MRADPDAGHVSGAARMKFSFTILRCLFRKFSTWKLCSQAQSAAGPGCPWASPIPLGARFASLCSGWMPALAHFEPAWSGARSYEAPPPNAWPPQAPFTLEPGPWAQGCVSLRRQRCGFGVRGAGGWAVVTLPSSPPHRLPGLGPQEDAAGGLRGAAQHGAEARPAAAARLRPHPRRSAGGWGWGRASPARGASLALHCRGSRECLAPWLSVSDCRNPSVTFLEPGNPAAPQLGCLGDGWGLFAGGDIWSGHGRGGVRLQRGTLWALYSRWPCPVADNPMAWHTVGA